jgi:hypothetical protein
VLISDAAPPDEGASTIQPARRVNRHHPGRVMATLIDAGDRRGASLRVMISTCRWRRRQLTHSG